MTPTEIEVAALRAVISALLTVDAPAQARILRAAGEFVGVKERP